MLTVSGWMKLIFGYWMLDAGYWILDAGYWMLGCRVGHKKNQNMFWKKNKSTSKKATIILGMIMLQEDESFESQLFI
jgi:hypothetical protein